MIYATPVCENLGGFFYYLMIQQFVKHIKLNKGEIIVLQLLYNDAVVH